MIWSKSVAYLGVSHHIGLWFILKYVMKVAILLDLEKD